MHPCKAKRREEEDGDNVCDSGIHQNWLKFENKWKIKVRKNVCFLAERIIQTELNVN